MALLRLVFMLMRFPSVVRLVTRLMTDRRVPLWLKLIIPAGVVYFVLRIDIIPDMLPVIGRIDDLLVLAGSVLAFLLLAPKEIVSEHLGTGGRASNSKSGPDVIDGKYHVVDDGEESER
jgi:uncharacterized membrane protein YkvA (DUF1232 family)